MLFLWGHKYSIVIMYTFLSPKVTFTLVPVPGPGVHRQRGCCSRPVPSQRGTGPWPGYSVCTAWPLLWSHEDTAAGNLWTGDPPPTIHHYLNMCTKCLLLGRLQDPWNVIYLHLGVSCLTISVCEDSGVLNESHISISHRQTPELTREVVESSGQRSKFKLEDNHKLKILLRGGWQLRITMLRTLMIKPAS